MQSILPDWNTRGEVKAIEQFGVELFFLFDTALQTLGDVDGESRTKAVHVLEGMMLFDGFDNGIRKAPHRKQVSCDLGM